MTDAAVAARAYFPRGLAQPDASFRFSADALLLAAFGLRRCLPEQGGTLLDLGCGCGIVGLACLLASPELTATGVDVLPELAEAARENAARLGLGDRFAASALDLAAGPEREGLGKNAYAVVLANMPFRVLGAGRLPRAAARQKALFADKTTMPAFLATARQALAEEGNCAFIYPWDARETLLRALEEHRLSPVEMMPVETGRADGARCLVRAVHTESLPGRTVRHVPPLRLYAGKGVYTEEALSFCPWLASRPWAW